MRSSKSLWVPALLILIALTLLGLGLKDGQFLETLGNGAKVCLQCIGIQ